VSVADTKISNSRFHSWPAIRFGLSAEISALSAELNETQWLSPEAIETRQMRQFRHLLRFVVQHSPWYARRLSAAVGNVSEFDSIESLQRLPLLSRQDLQSAGDEFYCVDVPADQGKIAETQTSGSTGEPVRIRKTGINQLFWYACTLRDHAWHEIPFDARFSAIRQSAETYSESRNWGPPYTFMLETGASQGIPITTPLTEQYNRLLDFQPEILLIYPGNLRPMLEIWRDRGGLSSLKHIKSIGETLTDGLRQEVLEFDAGISISDTYSSEECGTIALQCPDGGGHHVMSESLILEVLDEDGVPCEPGQSGRVAVTDLQNLASPLIRYDIGDYAELGEPCSCGRGLKKISRILGRRRNLIVKPNGDRHWPMVGFQEFRSIAPIRQYQMIQETVERITVHFVCDEPLSEAQKTAFTRHIQKALGYEFELEILDQREDLPRQPGGKFAEFVCRVP